MKYVMLLLLSHCDVKGLILRVLSLDCVNVSPLLEGPQSLSGTDLSENLKDRNTNQCTSSVLVMSQNHFLFR